MNQILIKRWLPAFGSNPRAKLRLFCLPHAGGGASAFYSWTAVLPFSIEVCPVQLPGREARLGEPCFRSVSELTGALRPVIEAAADRPFAIFGHSMGALVAFELARALPPEHLFVAGHAAPHLPHLDPNLHHVPDDRFIAEVERRYQAIPAGVKTDAELLALILPPLRGDFEIVETYRHQHGAALLCPISAFGGAANASTSMQDLDAWRMHTRSAFLLHTLPGGHFFVQTARERMLNGILEDLRHAL